MNEQPTETRGPLPVSASDQGAEGETARPPSGGQATAQEGEFSPAPLLPRRQPGEPHPYMLERNPPNLWMLVFMTVGSLLAAAIVMVLTVLL